MKVLNQTLLFGVLLLGSNSAQAQTPLSVQSPARPLGLDIVSPVYHAGSDAAWGTYSASDLNETGAQKQRG